MTSENRRYHAAGHIAAAIYVASKQPEAARSILSVVEEWAKLPSVSAPPAVLELLGLAKADPAARSNEMILLETWFVDPFNTIIENSGAKFK